MMAPTSSRGGLFPHSVLTVQGYLASETTPTPKNPPRTLGIGQAYGRATSLIRNSVPPGPYSRDLGGRCLYIDLDIHIYT